jgi:hypothetical protein
MAADDISTNLAGVSFSKSLHGLTDIFLFKNFGGHFFNENKNKMK